MAERVDERDSTVSVAILSNVGSEPSEFDQRNGLVLESDILTSKCWHYLYIRRGCRVKGA